MNSFLTSRLPRQCHRRCLSSLFSVGEQLVFHKVAKPFEFEFLIRNAILCMVKSDRQDHPLSPSICMLPSFNGTSECDTVGGNIAGC